MDSPDFDAAKAGQLLLARAAALASHSDSPDHYTRTFLTPAHREAAGCIAGWMREAGMAVRVDAIGNVIGRYKAGSGSKTLLMGSHFDSVRNGGKYDGVLGILIPIACVAELQRRGERLPVALEVAAFSDEEGARFQTSFLSSRALIGRFDPAVLERVDAEGIVFTAAMRAAGLDPSAIAGARMDPDRLAGYVEVHIEQGPVLLGRGAPLGVVTTIAGGSRHRVEVRGEAGHAGTVPMAMRHDALAAAAEMVLAVEQRCGAGGSLVGTVGILEVREGTGNVIPGAVQFTCDIRAGDDATRHAAERDVFAAFESIAHRRGVAVQRSKTHEVHAVPCAGWLRERLAAAIRAVSQTGVRHESAVPCLTPVGDPIYLPSGAGHDAMILAEVTDVGMMFVRCGAGGVSHNPAETVTAEDAGTAAAALLRFLRDFAAQAA